MGWKNWHYWLKGGVKAIIIGLILNILFIVPLFFLVQGSVAEVISFIGRYILPLWSSIMGITLLLAIKNLIIALIGYFIIGALIGGIYGKLRSKK